MSGGGGFRGRGFATRGYRRQGVDRSGASIARPNRHDCRGGGVRPQGPRPGFHGGGSRSNVQPDGKNMQGGVGIFCGPRQNFIPSRGPPMHQPQVPDSNWSGNNWSGNNWTDTNMGNNWSNNNTGNNWSGNDLPNNWLDNNSGNNWSNNAAGHNWSDDSPGNNWSDNNLGNNWSCNTPGNNWSSQAAGPPHGGFSTWAGGCPTRFNAPPIPPFYRSPGQNTFGPYRFAPPLETNYPPPSMPDYSPTVEAETQNTRKPPTHPPNAAHPKKPPAKASKPQKPIIHPGSEEERLQKITEAADKLKRTLSTIKKKPDTWDNEDDSGALEFNQQDADHEPRTANRGIPELKHDPPELDLTINDLRDIGRVDHDHTTKTTKSSNDADQDIDETEVEILEHNPVQRVPEATIDIDLWPEDNPDDSTLNQLAETNDNTEASNDIPEPSQTVDGNPLESPNDETVSTSKKVDSKCGDETSMQEFQDQETAQEIINENTMKNDTQNLNSDRENISSCSSSEVEQNEMFDENFHGNDENTQTTEMEASSSQEIRPEPQSIVRPAELQATESSKTIENVPITDDFENDANSQNVTTLVSTSDPKKTSNEEKIDNEKEIGDFGIILDQRIETREKSILLTRPEEPEIRAASDKVSIDEKTEESREKITIVSDNVVSSNVAVRNENETLESRVELTQALNESSSGDARTEEKNDHRTCCEQMTNSSTQRNMSDVTIDQSEDGAKEKVATTGNEHSSSKCNDHDSIETKIDKNIDSQARKKVEEKSAKSQDIDIVEDRQEASSATKTETRKLEESWRAQVETDGKGRERKKLNRTVFDGFSSRNRKSTPDSRNPNDCQSLVEGGTSPNATSHRSHRNQSPLSSNIEKSNYAISGSGRTRSKEENASAMKKLNRKQRQENISGVEEPVQSVLPPAFDPRLSSLERSVLMSSSMPMKQDFTMAPGYPSCTMTNLVPSVTPINYGVPAGVPPPTTIMTTSMKQPVSNIPAMGMPDPFVPILPLANVPIVSPMVLPNELMLRPPLPVELPPPPPPPQKATIDMEAELGDMQEAMEFAKKLMNMNDSVEPSAEDILDPDISEENGFFHMPTFPDLPPIELPAVPANETQPVENPNSEKPVKRESSTSIKRETKTYGPAPMPEEYQKSPARNENTEESSGLTEEELRPKVVFNLNTRSKIINKHDEWHQQNQRVEASETLSPFVPTTPNPVSPVVVTTKERSRTTNGHEERKKHDEKAGTTRFNGKLNSSGYSRGNKNFEDTISRSPTPPKHAIHQKSCKRNDEHSRNDQTNKNDITKRSSTETAPKKSTNDAQTPESSWKSRVIGRFLKMSKNDIGNMLNNASLRKFDIAMKHLVKERRSSLSLEMRNNEEERMRDAEVSYNREEFMDQLSAMLDPSATVDVCNLPTQFIHHLSEVLHLDTMSEFDSSQTMSERLGDVSSPATQSSPNSESLKQIGSRETASTKESNLVYEQTHDRKRRRVTSTSLATTPTGAPEKCKVSRTSLKPTGESANPENIRMENVENRAVSGPRSKRRRVRATIANHQSPTTNNASLVENDSSSLNMADLDDIFSAGIARAKKKSHDSPMLRKEKRNVELLNMEKNNVPVVKEASVDRVERAVDELDEIFTAGIARAKLASKKVAESVNSVEIDDENDDERDWNRGNLRMNADSHRLQWRSSSSGRKTSKIEQWSRHVLCDEPVAFRNLTKEEWEAKYSEPSYSAYQREYRAMEALREERSRRSSSSDGKPDYNAFDINDLGSIKSRLGEPVGGNVEYHEDWSGSDDSSRSRNVNEVTNYTVDYNRSSADDSSSTTSSGSSSSSEDENNEATPSVTKLLKVIKEREKMAKQKSLNEEIRDEVTAEIERKKRERDKLRKRHRPRAKKTSHHRRKKEKKGKGREKKKRERKRKKRKSSRRSDENSKENSENEGADEEYISSGSRGRDSRRLLNEDEIKKEIVVKEEPDIEIPPPNEKTPVKSCTNVKSVDDSQPASITSSSSSVLSVVTASSSTQSIAHQTKTKAQLKQMPVEVKKRVATVTNVNEEPAKNHQDVQVNEESRENIVDNILPAASEIPDLSNELDNYSVSSVAAVIIPALSLQQTSAASHDASSLKTNSKKLDIKTYKERARQRQLKQSEHFRLSTENPSLLTQNLLNIPLSRKNDVQTLEPNSIEPLKDPRLRRVEETSHSVPMNFDEKLDNVASTTNVVCAPNATVGILKSSNNIQENVSSSKVSRKKIKRPNFTTAQTSGESIPKDSSADLQKFAHIKSEGRKELKLREKLKKGHLRTSTETPESSGSPIVPPTRLNRRRSLVTAETTVVATELKKTNQVPLSSKLDSTSTCDNFGSMEMVETLNKTPKEGEGRILCLSQNSNSIESLDSTKNAIATKSLELTTNADQEKSLEISKPLHGEKSLDEPTIPDRIDTNETLISSSCNSKACDNTNIVETSTNVGLGEASNISTNLEITKISDDPKPQDSPKHSDDAATLDSSDLERVKNSNVPIQPNTGETLKPEEKFNISEILETRETLSNVQDSNTEEFSEKLEAPEMQAKVEKMENSEMPEISDTFEAVSENSGNPEGATCLETLSVTAEPTKTLDEPKLSPGKLSLTEELTKSEIQNPLPMREAIEKNEPVLTETELISLEMPNEELPDWSLDAPAISSNIPESLDYSNDSVPFKGFTEQETILRRDRVLTEAEITEDSEFNTFDSVPLNFVSETTTSTAGNIDLDEITTTDVVDSLDSLPLTYSEQFPDAQDDIEVSLPDPLGHTIYTMASEIVDRSLETFTNDETNDKVFERQEQSIQVETPVPRSNDLENLSSINNFLIDDVNTRETVPSPILVSEANDSEEPNIAELTKSTSDKIEKVNTPVSQNEVTEEGNLSIELSKNVESLVSTIEPHPTGAEIPNTGANDFLVEENIPSEIKSSLSATNDDNFVENSVPEVSEVPDVNLDAKLTKETQLIETSPKNYDTRNENIEKNVRQTDDETATTEEAGNSSIIQQEKHDSESKSKDSSHHSKEHSHGKVKKKSSRNHNHGSKTSKKSTLTEKLVDDAITADVVKLVKPNSRHTVMARMMEIDVEIHKLMNEKMTLYKMLESGDFTSTENQDCAEKTMSEKEKDTEAGQVHNSRPALAKTTEETTKKLDAKQSHLEIEDKTKKQKKSPHRETKHRSRERNIAEPRLERKASESKSHSSKRATLGEETSRHEISVNSLREKSTSLTDLEDTTEEKRRRKEKSPTHQSSKRHNLHSSKEDLLEVSRDSLKAEKSSRSDSTKREKSKKSAKPSIEVKKSETSLKKSKSREGKSSSEKIIMSSTDNIYSDESNFELQESRDSTKSRETSSKKDEMASSTGLTLLDESLKREMAQHRKTKNVEKRKKKKRHELRRSLLSATVLTASEAKTGLMNLFERKKLHKKKNAAFSETQDKSRSRNPGKVSKHLFNIIDAVATNQVEQLYIANSQATSAQDETPKTTGVQENRVVEANENEERIEKEGEEKIIPRSTDEPTKKTKKVQHPGEVEKSIKDCRDLSSRKNQDSVQSQEKKEDSNHEEFHNRENSPVPSESEIPDIPKTPDIVEENLINSDSEIIQEENISNAALANTEKSVKISKTDLTAEEEDAQEKRAEVGHRSRSVTPEYPEPSGSDSNGKKHRGDERQFEDSGEEKRGVKIVEVAIEMNNTLVEDTEEIIPRSRSRANSRRTKQRGKSRSRTRKERKSQHKDPRSSPLRQEYVSDDNDQDDVSLRRPRSATNRNNNKHREKAGPPSRRGSRQSEESAKSTTRGKKRDHERSTSRGLSPYDGEPSRKRSQSYRSVTPTIPSITLSDQQSKKKGKKRKHRGEMSVEEMMRCKVELIDCKYTYLSPTMHPKILKKLGISRINRYVAPSKIIENLSPPILTRNETPSPPMLSKAFEAEYPRKELDDIIEKIEIPERLGKSVSTREIVEQDRMEDDEEEEAGEVKIRSPIECLIVKEHVDEVDEDEDDEDDDNIQIVKVLDDQLPITPQGVEDDEVRNVKDMEHEESSQIGTNENRPEVIAVEEDYDTTEEYEVIDEVTDENEDEIEETDDEVQVVDSTETGRTVRENPAEPEELLQPDDNDNENEPRRTRYTVHKGPILDIKVLEDSFLAASEDGAIYRYSQTSNGILNIYKGHEAAVTCIYVLEMPAKRWNLYSGSLDGTFRCYDITTGAQDRSANVGSPVQCMDQGWGIIYIGTKSGHISRYSIKSGSLKGDRLEFSDKSVLALKASAEGPRRVLIVASRNQPITIRDANTGLFLRTICGYKNHTVYSLMRDRNLVYCGTSSTSIPVYDFINGEQVTQYNAGVGIVCMRLYRQILFAGCYDGNIYVFDTLESKLLCSIPGPGNMLLSMEVVNDEIIAGSKNRQLHSWRMPKKVRGLLAGRT